MPGDPNNTFDDRMADLADDVGDGDLVGDLDRDQVYAQYQHETPNLRHPQGQWKYQETALMVGHQGYLQTIADHVHGPGGPARGMERVMEEFDGDAGELCPKDFTILAHSGRPVVTSDGREVYNRPPEVPRLSDAELESIRAHGVVGVTTNNPNPRRI